MAMGWLLHRRLLVSFLIAGHQGGVWCALFAEAAEVANASPAQPSSLHAVQDDVKVVTDGSVVAVPRGPAAHAKGNATATVADASGNASPTVPHPGNSEPTEQPAVVATTTAEPVGTAAAKNHTEPADDDPTGLLAKFTLYVMNTPSVGLPLGLAGLLFVGYVHYSRQVKEEETAMFRDLRAMEEGGSHLPHWQRGRGEALDANHPGSRRPRLVPFGPSSVSSGNAGSTTSYMELTTPR
eukprot:TRINITY_DN91982_c0_g1_i1.p1 TRINITY_DN91982_c0_g1~~TRINITY_DN91982_c0_g1_i1.p1  ORF type:complete len:239 (-),score=42.54 TRINITY_DN91982_c0_g1_i1:141-857(-)